MDRDVFKDHIAEYWQTQNLGMTVERILFRNPASSNYYINFLCFQGTLVVTGDAYEAIYCVYSAHSISWFASCDAGYLSGKLRGLNGCPEERKVWCEDQAKKEVQSHIKDSETTTEEAKKEYWEEAKSYLSSQHDWITFLEDDERAKHYFGSDVYEYYDIGMIRNPQIDLQIEGLQKAVKQLKEKGVL